MDRAKRARPQTAWDVNPLFMIHWKDDICFSCTPYLAQRNHSEKNNLPVPASPMPPPPHPIIKEINTFKQFCAKREIRPHSTGLLSCASDHWTTAAQYMLHKRERLNVAQFWAGDRCILKRHSPVPESKYSRQKTTRIDTFENGSWYSDEQTQIMENLIVASGNLDKKQLTALHHAIMVNCLQAVQALCAAGQTLYAAGQAFCAAGQTQCASDQPLCASGPAHCAAGQALCASGKTFCASGWRHSVLQVRHTVLWVRRTVVHVRHSVLQVRHFVLQVRHLVLYFVLQVRASKLPVRHSVLQVRHSVLNVTRSVR